MVEKYTYTKEKLSPQNVVGKAFKATEGLLFPIARVFPYPGLEKAVKENDPHDAKFERAAKSAFRALGKFYSELGVRSPDILRSWYGGEFIKNAANFDSTASAVRWSLAAGVLLSPNIVYLASKIKPVARAGRALRESVINKIDPANKIIRR